MIFSEILNTYFGWCPRYNVNTPETTSNPIQNLSAIVKIAAITILGAYGIYNLFIYQRAISSFWSQIQLGLSLGIPDPQLIAFLLTLISKAVSGAILIILLADFIASRSILKRHRIELSALLITQAIYWLLAPVGLTQELTDWGSYAVEWLYSLGALGIIQAVLLLFMTYRLLSNRVVLGRNTFLLLSALLFVSMIYPFAIVLRPISPMRSTQNIFTIWDWRYLAERGVESFVYLVAAVFCFKVYLDLRKTSDFELSLPKYIRGIVVLWSLYSLGVAYDVLYWNFSGLLSLNVFVYAFFLGLIAVSFLPLRFRVGENVHDTPEIKS